MLRGAALSPRLTLPPRPAPGSLCGSLGEGPSHVFSQGAYLCGFAQIHVNESVMIHVNLSKLWEIVEDRGAWHAIDCEVAKSQT